ncbi:MAG TPA: DUF5618 family protein [Candidatus Brocadiaceae bacterium]|nr:DUF5618 family protein [Candidatus Brocadiaceae bacterium]
MKESLRYLQNAKEILARIPIEDNDYVDIKPVREAFSTAYLAILEAINEALLEKGVHKKELPKSVDAYRIALKKHFATHNGKLARKFEHLYDTLHIAGYYRGLIHNATLVKESLKAAKEFIDKFK